MMKKKTGSEILYDVYPVPNPTNKDQVRYSVRPIYQRMVNIDDMAEQIEKESTLTKSDVKGALMAFSNNLATVLAGGDRVHLPGIGYFSMKLKCTDELDPEKSRSPHIEFDTINFRPDTVFKKQISGFKFRRCKVNHDKVPSTEEIERKISEYLTKNSFILRTNVQSLFSVSKSSACKIIRELQVQGKLVNKGGKYAPVYIWSGE